MFNVYMIKNLVNGLCYIGVTSDIKDRLSHHLSELRHNRHGNDLLQEDFNIYGESNFEITILEQFDDVDSVADKEIYYIAKYNSCDCGYNKTGGGEGYGKRAYTEKSLNLARERMLGNTYGLGKSRTEEQRKNYSDSWHTSRTKEQLDEHSNRAKAVLCDLWKTDSFREKMKSIHTGNTWGKGRIVSEEQRKKLSTMQQGENNSFFGKHHTDRTKKIISEKAKSFYSDANNREKHRQSVLNFIHTDEYRQKQSMLSRGRSRIGTTEKDAINIRYRYLCGHSPVDISKDYPKISLSALKKICYATTWKHLPNTKEELYNMLINYQSKEESLEGLETKLVDQNG